MKFKAFAALAMFASLACGQQPVAPAQAQHQAVGPSVPNDDLTETDRLKIVNAEQRIEIARLRAELAKVLADQSGGDLQQALQSIKQEHKWLDRDIEINPQNGLPLVVKTSTK